MRSTWLGLAAAAVLVVAPALAQVTWRPFSDAKAGVSAEFPGPVTAKNSTGTATGETNSTMFEYGAEDAYYAVAVTDFSMAVDLDPKAALDAGVAGGVANIKGTLQSQTSVTVSGSPGREVVITAEGLIAHARIVVRGKRLYQAIAVQVPTGDEATALRFVRSLKLAAP